MSLVNTRLQNIRAKSNIDKYEFRPSRYGALNAFMVQSEDPTGILTEELKEKARTSIGNILETPVIDYDADITIGNTRELTIADSENTSQMVQINFATFAWGFTVTPALYMNNEIGIQRDFETKMKKYIFKFAEVLDKACIAKLEATKTKILKEKLTYDFTGNKVGVNWDQRNSFMADLNILQSGNDFFGTQHVITNGGVESILKQLQQHGLYNDVNKQNEYNDKIIHLTNFLANAEGDAGSGYVVNSGSLGMLTRFERECLLNTVSGDGHEWSIDTLPYIGMPCGTYFYDSVGNFSTLAGAASADMVRNRKEHYGFAVDIAFITAYNSAPDTLASPIISFGVKKGSNSLSVNVVSSEATPVYTKAVTA